MKRRPCILLALGLRAVFALVAVASMSSCSNPSAQRTHADAGVIDGGGHGGAISDGGGGSPADAGGEPDAFDPGDMPVWEPFGNMFLDCPIEKVSNADSVRVFGWAPCESTLNCERMVYPSWLSVSSDILAGIDLSNAQLRDTTVGPVIALAFVVPPQGIMVLVVREDGQLVAGFRTRKDTNDCLLGSGAVGGGHYGITLTSLMPPNPRRWGGLLGAFSNPGLPALFEITNIPLGYGPFPTAMNDSRWLWRCAPDQYVTVSAVDGSNPISLVKASSPAPGAVLGLTPLPTSTGPTFLFQEVSTPDGMNAQSRIAVSDGVQSPQTYFTPPPGAWDYHPSYAHTHLGWFRGFNPQGLGTYDKIEVWASPYSADPAALVPYKVDDYPLNHADTWILGGHGWLAAQSGKDPPVFGELYAWNLATKARKAFVLPGGRSIYRLVGISPARAWIAGSSGNPAPADMIARFTLDP